MAVNRSIILSNYIEENVTFKHVFHMTKQLVPLLSSSTPIQTPSANSTWPINSTVPTVSVGLLVSCTRLCMPTIGALTWPRNAFLCFMLENDIDLSFLVSASLTCDHEVEEVDTLVRTVEVDSVLFDNRCC